VALSISGLPGTGWPRGSSSAKWKKPSYSTLLEEKPPVEGSESSTRGMAPEGWLKDSSPVEVSISWDPATTASVPSSTGARTNIKIKALRLIDTPLSTAVPRTPRV
jgi:hypothetical protein